MSDTTTITRRNFVRRSALVSGGAALLPTLISACQYNELAPTYTGDFGFREGVATPSIAT
jgi:alkaline phosphatase D